ncbi:MAG: amino acid-binding protein [Planctomycetota bacterium]
MAMKIERVKVWAVSLEDKPGALAAKLAALAQAGADLEFVFARTLGEPAGTGVACVTPLKGPAQIRAAKAAGFEDLSRINTVRIETPDAQGVAARLTEKVAAANLNLRGFSASAHGKKGIIYLAFESGADAAAAVRVLKRLR